MLAVLLVSVSFHGPAGSDACSTRQARVRSPLMPPAGSDANLSSTCASAASSAEDRRVVPAAPSLLRVAASVSLEGRGLRLRLPTAESRCPSVRAQRALACTSDGVASEVALLARVALSCRLAPAPPASLAAAAKGPAGGGGGWAGRGRVRRTRASC